LLQTVPLREEGIHTPRRDINLQHRKAKLTATSKGVGKWKPLPTSPDGGYLNSEINALH
jgi:hypothetical protein